VDLIESVMSKSSVNLILHLKLYYDLMLLELETSYLCRLLNGFFLFPFCPVSCFFIIYLYDTMTCDESLDPDINFMDRIKNCNRKYLREDQFATFFKFSDLGCVNLMHVNCRSLQKNFKPLVNLLYIASCLFTAIALTETWLTPQNQN